MDPNTVTIGAAVVLFAALFGFWSRLDTKIERLDTKLSGEVNSLDTKLSGEINSLDKKLSGEINSLDRKLSGEINSLDKKLSGEINSLDKKLSGEIKEVRLASEAAHKEIIGRLGGIETTQATHTERFNTISARIDCVEDKIDSLNT